MRKMIGAALAIVAALAVVGFPAGADEWTTVALESDSGRRPAVTVAATVENAEQVAVRVRARPRGRVRGSAVVSCGPNVADTVRTSFAGRAPLQRDLLLPADTTACDVTVDARLRGRGRITVRLLVVEAAPAPTPTPSPTPTTHVVTYAVERASGIAFETTITYDTVGGPVTVETTEQSWSVTAYGVPAGTDVTLWARWMGGGIDSPRYSCSVAVDGVVVDESSGLDTCVTGTTVGEGAS